MSEKSQTDFNIYSFYSILIASLSSFLFGINITGNQILEKDFKQMLNKSTSHKWLHINDEGVWEVTVTILLFGAFVGSFLPNLLQISGKKGIKTCFLLYCIGYIVYWGINNPLTCILGRFISGIAIGICSNVTVPYLLSASPIRFRGVIGSIFQFMIVFGIFMAQIINYFFRTEILLGQMFLIVLIALSAILGAFSFTIQSAKDSNNELNAMGFKSLLSNSNSKKSIICAFALHIFQQLSGINGILFFSNEIFKKTGNQEFFTLGLGIINLASCIVVMFIIDRFGRKPLLIGSSIFVLAGYLLIITDISTVYGIYIYIIGFSLGLGPVVWIVGSEIFPAKYTSAANSLIVPFNWLMGFIISSILPLLYNKFGVMSFYLYAIFISLFLVFAIKFLPETKGKPLDFID